MLFVKRQKMPRSLSLVEVTGMNKNIALLAYLVLIWLVGMNPVSIFAKSENKIPRANKTYTALTPESFISYHLTHPMVEMKGINHKVNCVVELNSDSSQGHIAVDTEIKNFDSGNSDRDMHALEVLDVYRFPKVEFVSEIFKRTKPGSYEVTGTLTFHGISKPLVFPITVEKKTGKVFVDGEFKISMNDHKIHKPALMLIPVDDSLGISIHMVADTVGVLLPVKQ